MTYHGSYGDNGLKTWQWVITAVVIVVLIIIGIFVFGEKPKTDDVQTSTKDYNSPLEYKLKKCFADGGYVRTELSAFRNMTDVDTLVCHIEQVRNL